MHNRSRTDTNVFRQAGSRCKIFVITYMVIYSLQHYFHEIPFPILFVFIVVINEPFVRIRVALDPKLKFYAILASAPQKARTFFHPSKGLHLEKIFKTRAFRLRLHSIQTKKWLNILYKRIII